MDTQERFALFSPCKSAFSCGILSKHRSKKLKRSNLEKEINRLEEKLRTAAKDVENTIRAADKVINSSSRQIEDVIINEMPDRYTSYGLRNWALLNKDVAILQRNLKGKLPSRDNVKKLLAKIVMKGTDCSKSSSTRVSFTSIYSDLRKQTDHRMSLQKRLLSEEYAINFPTEKKSCVTMSTQEQTDFKLALLQQQEMESRSEYEISPCSEPITTTRVNNELDLNVNPDASVSSECSTEREDLEFQANAAAALLELQRRSSFPK